MELESNLRQMKEEDLMNKENLFVGIKNNIQHQVTDTKPWLGSNDALPLATRVGPGDLRGGRV